MSNFGAHLIILTMLRQQADTRSGIPLFRIACHGISRMWD
ncbi:unnamed protein product, partial [Larinioides sclopetarius]